MRFATVLSVLILLTLFTYSRQENQFFKAVRDAARNNGTNRGNDKDNALKNEVKKYLQECGSDSSGEESSEFSEDYGGKRDNRKHNKHDGSSGTYPEFYGDSKYYTYNTRMKQNDRDYNRDNRHEGGKGHERSYGYGSLDFNNNYGRNADDNNNNNRRDLDREINSRYERNRARQYGETNHPLGYDDFNEGISPGAGNYGNTFNHNRKMGYNNNGYDSGRQMYGSTDAYGSDGYVRRKRKDENCISQCAFGYLEVLDENRVPSETALIKYLQDHIRNDRKRIQSLRDARRCFGRLATIDNEDGCEFSKQLSKCLKLEIE